VLLTTISSFRDTQALVLARAMRVPVWLRTETQDEAYTRSRLKTWARRRVYRPIYRRIEQFFYIGSLNRRHFANHGVPPEKMSASLYATLDPTAGLTEDDKWRLRHEAHEAVGIADDAVVVGFAGKFIEKKNPLLLFDMLPHLNDGLRQRLHFYFVGSGELESSLRAAARQAQSHYGVRSHFAGFINQSQLGKHYCAMDVFVLPSKRMGETWGLVVNEALQCGCSAVVSSAVGCGADFSGLERFRVFEENQAGDLADKVASLAGIPRSFTWAEEALQAYSVDRAASEIARWLQEPSASVA
jgi:glycosyltransferase involved in cell wall biosynthesis